MDEKLKDKDRESKISMIGPLAGLIAAIITANLSTKLHYIMALLLVVITTVSIYVVFGHHFKSLFQKLKTELRNRLLFKKYFSYFSIFVDRLSEFTLDSHCDTLPYVFAKMKSNLPELNHSHSLMHDLNNFLASYNIWMNKFSKQDFSLIIDWFESILRIYHNQLVLEPFRQLRNMDINKLSKYEKEEYEKNRERYIRFLEDYENFARSINRDAGKTIARPYFDRPGTLPNNNTQIIEGK